MVQKFNDSSLCDIARSFLDFSDKNIVDILNKERDLSITERNTLLDYISKHKKSKSIRQMRDDILKIVNYEKSGKSTYLNRNEMEAVLTFLTKTNKTK